jgi:hypothetical protein
VRYDRLLLFTAGDPNNVLSPDSQKVRSGPGVSAVRFKGSTFIGSGFNVPGSRLKNGNLFLNLLYETTHSWNSEPQNIESSSGGL